MGSLVALRTRTAGLTDIVQHTESFLNFGDRMALTEAVLAPKPLSVEHKWSMALEGMRSSSTAGTLSSEWDVSPYSSLDLLG